MGYANRPLGRDGKVMRYRFAAHSGCARKANCTAPRQSRIKAEWFRWAAAYGLSRRGGLASAIRIEPQSAGGYLQAIREKNAADINRTINEGGTGTGEGRSEQQWWWQSSPCTGGMGRENSGTVRNDHPMLDRGVLRRAKTRYSNRAAKPCLH